MDEAKVEVKVLDYKTMGYTCSNCAHKGYKKVQAEVDMQIGVEMIKLAEEENVNSITLLAGDRDFVPAIMHVMERWHKPVTIIGFKNTVSKRFSEL